MSMNTIEELQHWFAQHCNGEWEHRQGITIQTCDNPGWWVKVDLTGTPLAGRPFEPVSENVDQEGFQLGPRWLCCQIREGVWHGAGDQTQLGEILRRFLGWARQQVASP